MLLVVFSLSSFDGSLVFVSWFMMIPTSIHSYMGSGF